MKRKFTVILTQEGDSYIARCPDVADAVACGTNIEDALDRLRAVIIKRLGDDPDSGSVPEPHPLSPRPCGPRGPLVAEIELPNDHAG